MRLWPRRRCVSFKDVSETQCPDGSWSKWQARRCSLPLGHTGPHNYELRAIQPHVSKEHPE